MSVIVTEYCHKCKKQTLHSKNNKNFGYNCEVCKAWTVGGIQLGEQYKNVFNKILEEFKSVN